MEHKYTYTLNFKEDGESWNIYLDNEFVFNSSPCFEGYKNRLEAETFLNKYGTIENTHLDETTYCSDKIIEELKLLYKEMFKY